MKPPALILLPEPSPELQQAMSNLGAVRQEVVDAFGIPAHLLREPSLAAKRRAMDELILQELRQATGSKA